MLLVMYRVSFDFRKPLESLETSSLCYLYLRALLALALALGQSNYPEVFSKLFSQINLRNSKKNCTKYR